MSGGTTLLHWTGICLDLATALMRTSDWSRGSPEMVAVSFQQRSPGEPAVGICSLPVYPYPHLYKDFQQSPLPESSHAALSVSQGIPVLLDGRSGLGVLPLTSGGQHPPAGKRALDKVAPFNLHPVGQHLVPEMHRPVSTCQGLRGGKASSTRRLKRSKGK